MSGKIHTMRIADSSGDSTITWEVDNAAQVQAAQDQFEALVNKGHQAFAFPVTGQDGVMTKTFDPNVEKIIVMPPAAGG